MRIDLHTHSVFSDGELLPIELIRRAWVLDHDAIAITDHVSMSNVDKVVSKVARDCELAAEWGILAIPGVEITHVPVGRISEVVKLARANGARWVVVHGETLVEPVEPGTNLAAVKDPDVDLLAHPGMLTIEEAQLAKDNGVALELTSRRGHCLGNGLVAKLAREVGGVLLVNTDTHAPGDLIDADMALSIAMAAGLDTREAEEAVLRAPARLIGGL